MNYILDIGVIIVLAFFLIWGVRKGAVKSILSFASTVVAAFLASWLGKLLAQFIYTTFIQKGLTESIAKTITDNINSTTGQDSIISTLLKSLPNFVESSLSFFGININDIEVAMNSAGSTYESWSQNSAIQIEKLLSPIYITLISAITIIVVFIVLMILRKFIIRTICRVFNLPVLKQINGFLGAFVGILEGIVAVFMICLLIHLFLPFMNDVPNIFSNSVIETTGIFKHFYNFSIFSVFNSGANNMLGASALQSATQAVTQIETYAVN